MVFMPNKTMVLPILIKNLLPRVYLDHPFFFPDYGDNGYYRDYTTTGEISAI